MASTPVLISGNGSEHYAFPDDMFDQNYYRGYQKRDARLRPRLHLVYDELNADSKVYINTSYVLDFKFSGKRRFEKTKKNLGHWMLDVGAPLYKLQEIFLPGQVAGFVTFSKPYNTSVQTVDTYAWLRALFVAHPIHIDILHSPTTCFKSLIVGDRCMESFDYRANPRPGMPNFVNHIASVNGLSGRIPTKPHILLIAKVGRRVPENYNEVTTAISHEFPTVDFTIYNSSHSKGHWTVKKRIEVYAKTTLLLTPCGGISAVAPFLSYGATLIQFGFWDDSRNSSIEQDGYRYAEFSHIVLKTFPVLQQEHTRRSIPKGKKSDKGGYGMYSFHNYLLNVSRLVKMVKEDIYNWVLFTR